jgi:hypothetical protein
VKQSEDSLKQNPNWQNFTLCEELSEGLSIKCNGLHREGGKLEKVFAENLINSRLSRDVLVPYEYRHSSQGSAVEMLTRTRPRRTDSSLNPQLPAQSEFYTVCCPAQGLPNRYPMV